MVIEGPKAGGHLGFSEEELETITDASYEQEIQGIMEVVQTYDKKYGRHIPVVSAGGIYEGKDLRHALELGLDGVQAATRFVTTYECDAAKEYKQAYIQAEKEDIQIVRSPVGMPGRAIRNAFVVQSEKDRPEERRKNPRSCRQCLENCNPAEIPYCITEALINAVKGNLEQGLIFCGENAWRARKLEHVSEIMKEFANA